MQQHTIAKSSHNESAREKPEIQLRFLRARIGQPVMIRLLGGERRIGGTLKGFDEYTLLLEIEVDGRRGETLVYKHAIAYIT